MKPHCASAVRAAAGGRTISDAKLAKIDEALVRTMRELARRDRQLPPDKRRWAGLTHEQRQAEAVAKAMEDVQAAAALKEYQTGLQALRAADAEAAVLLQLNTRKGLTRSQAYVRHLENVNEAVQADQKAAVAQLEDLIHAAESTEDTGLFRNIGIRLFDLDNPRMTADIVREIYRNADGSTGNKAAQAGAKAWLHVIEQARQKKNAAGGDVGKLSYGYLPPAWDAVKIEKAGPDAFAKFVLDRVDREQYVRGDGALMDDAEVLAILKASQETLGSEGLNKTQPGQFKGGGSLANRGSEHRVIHLKDGDAWIETMAEFGEGSLYDAMMGHILRTVRDTTLMEHMGPNAAATHRVQADIARRIDRPHGRSFKELKDSRSAGVTPDGYWRLVSGETGAPEIRALARGWQDARNMQTAAKITWGPFSALADIGTIAQTLHFHRIPYFQYLQSLGRQMSADARAELRTHGVISDSYLHSLNRWTGDNMTHSLSGRITNAVMHLSLMNMWTNAGRNAFSDALMHNWTSRLGKAWRELDEWDRFLVGQHGITEADWAIISKATPDPESATPFLSPPRIRATGIDGAERAATKWGAFVGSEAEFAVVNPDLAARAIVTGGGAPAGTPAGETARTFWQFKAFPLSMLTRHWRRVFETPQGLEGAPAGYRGTVFGADVPGGGTVNRIAALAALGFTTTMLGAIQTQSRAILTGKDPITMDPTDEHGRKFWQKAFAAGGGSGFLADVLMAPMDDPQYGFGGKLGLLGPLPGAAGGLLDVARSNHPAADAVRWTSDQLPLVDMWQTRALYEHWFLHNAQESLNPGYLSRMQRRTQKNWGQSSWWAPGEMLPDRAPDLGAAIGQ